LVGEVVIERERCKGCHLCLAFCPRHLLEADARLNQKGYQPVLFLQIEDEDRGCTGCAMCALVCPEVAIEVYRAQ